MPTTLHLVQRPTNPSEGHQSHLPPTGPIEARSKTLYGLTQHNKVTQDEFESETFTVMPIHVYYIDLH
jgi:hypothetical protein